MPLGAQVQCMFRKMACQQLSVPDGIGGSYKVYGLETSLISYISGWICLSNSFFVRLGGPKDIFLLSAIEAAIFKLQSSYQISCALRVKS